MRKEVAAVVTTLLAASGCNSEPGMEGQTATPMNRVAEQKAAVPQVESEMSAVALQEVNGVVTPLGLSCLDNWRSSGACGQWCLRETQEDRRHCYAFLDCYYSNNCGPSTCGAPDAVCGVNRFRWGMAPKIIADQVYQCLACPGSTPVTSCNGLPNTTPCTDNNACTTGERCQSNACTGGAPKTCNPLDQCHIAGTCNRTTGNCSNPIKPNGSSCNDGNACTAPDQCQSGLCQGTVLLGTPSGLTATPGSGQVQLAWTAATGAAGYHINRSTTAGGPYANVGTAPSPSFTDSHLPIGPTYYYVVTAFAACGESARTNEASATPFSDKTGPVPPGPGPCKTSAEALALDGQDDTLTSSADLKPPLSEIVVNPAKGRLPRKESFEAKARASQHQYARAEYALEQVSGAMKATPILARRLDGVFVPKPVLSDRLLVVGRTAKETVFAATVADPRVRRTIYNPANPSVGGVRLVASGIVTVDLPEAFLSTDLLRATTFSFYTMGPGVSAKTPVSIQALPALSRGAALLATSSGSALVPVLFPGSK
jgi:hypothetical protein